MPEYPPNAITLAVWVVWYTCGMMKKIPVVVKESAVAPQNPRVPFGSNPPDVE